jgi:hypothetical protein
MGINLSHRVRRLAEHCTDDLVAWHPDVGFMRRSKQTAEVRRELYAPHDGKSNSLG